MWSFRYHQALKYQGNVTKNIKGVWFKENWQTTKLEQRTWILVKLCFRVVSFGKLTFRELSFTSTCILEGCIKIKINWNFCPHTSLWHLKRFCEGLKGLLKTIWDTANKCESRNLLIFFLRTGSGRGGLCFTFMVIHCKQ